MLEFLFLSYHVGQNKKKKNVFSPLVISEKLQLIWVKNNSAQFRSDGTEYSCLPRNHVLNVKVKKILNESLENSSFNRKTKKNLWYLSWIEVKKNLIFRKPSRFYTFPHYSSFLCPVLIHKNIFWCYSPHKYKKY